MRFLIVDDDEKCRELLKDILSQFGHCECAINGEDALDRFKASLGGEDSYDAILLDIMMPGLDGQEVLKTIRMLEFELGIPLAQGVRIIMVTAMAKIEDLMTSVHRGCCSYVTKPIDEEQLLLELDAALGRPLTKLEHASSDSSKHDLSTTPSDEKRGAGAPPRPRLLVVDDDLLCRELMRDILAEHGECDFATTGREAIDAVIKSLENQSPYDAVLLDINMPDLDGHEALKGIREVEAKRHILGLAGVKVVMTTALRNSKNCVQAFRDGCEGYVTKPIDEVELIDKLREVGVLGGEPSGAQPMPL